MAFQMSWIEDWALQSILIWDSDSFKVKAGLTQFHPHTGMIQKGTSLGFDRKVQALGVTCRRW